MASSLDPFICDTCDRQLTSLHSFNRHIQFVHSNHRPHQCPQCFNCFKTIDALRSHRRLVHTIAQLGPFQCELCDALFKRVSSIASHHRLVHMPSDNIKCVDCTRTFRSDKHLQKHRQLMHSSNNVTVRCTNCPKIFKNQKNLRNHSHRMHRLLDDEWLKEVQFMKILYTNVIKECVSSGTFRGKNIWEWKSSNEIFLTKISSHLFAFLHQLHISTSR
jgi:hypothetical protein